MRIVIENSGYDMGNMGDRAMLVAAYSRLRELWPDADIHVLTWNPVAVARHLPGALAFPLRMPRSDESGSPARVGSAWDLTPTRGRREAEVKHSLVSRWPRLALAMVAWRRSRDGLAELVRSADLVVATGGGYLTDAFALKMMGALATLHLAIRSRKPVALLGQGLGPFRNSRLERLTASVLRRADFISLREKRFGLPFLRSAGVPESVVRVTGDDAVEIAYRTRSEALGRGLGISLRMAFYSAIGEESLARIRTGLKEALRGLRARLVPIPISFRTGEEDFQAIEQLVRGLEAPVLADDSILSQEELQRQIAVCRTVLTGSYHAGVFALSKGIPTVCLAKSDYYLTKFRGLADMFGEGCRVVDLNSPRSPEALAEALIESWGRAPAERPHLLAAARSQIAAAHEAYESLPEILGPRRPANRSRCVSL